MKRKVVTIIVFLFSIFLITACGNKVDDLGFKTEPSILVEGEDLFDMNAEAKSENAKIHYAVYLSSVTEKTAEEVVAGVNSVKKGKSENHILSEKVKLAKNTEYSVFFVIENSDKFGKVTKVTEKTKGETTLGFQSIALSGGDEEGTLKLNAATNGVGTIYYVLVKEGAKAPTNDQIVKGTEYDGVLIHSSGNKASFENLVIKDLVAGEKYTVYLVIKNEDKFSAIRNMTAEAKKVVVVVDKGQGTEESPFRISTIEDLEQIGSGYYEVDGKEWNMENHYVLENDIDLSTKYGKDKLNWPVLGADSMGSRFAGTLDGAGFTLKGLYIGKDSLAGEYRGLFASSEQTAVIKNLNIKDSFVHDGGIVEGNPNHGTGILYGYLKGLVQNVSIYNSEVYGVGTRIGGFGGRSYVTGSIINSYSNVKVTGFNRVGGFVGLVDVDDAANEPIIYKNLVFDGQVIAKDEHAGGIAGYARGIEASNIIVEGFIQGAKSTGGAFGFAQKRGGNNNVKMFIKDVIVYAKVHGIGAENSTVGLVLGNRSDSNLKPPVTPDFLVIENVYHVSGSEVLKGGSEFARNGEEISLEQFKDLNWYTTNMPGMNFEQDFEIKEGMQRPVLKGTLDNGLLEEIEEPLVVFEDIKSGPTEKKITIKISTSKEAAVINYIVLATQQTVTKEDILTPADTVLDSGNGAVIDKELTMDNYDQEYYVYYVVTFEEEVSEVVEVTVKSQEMTQLVITGGLKPGTNNKELIVNLTSNLDSTIYWIVVGAERGYTKEEIMNPTDVLFSGSGSKIENHLLTMEEAGVEYFVYAYAKAEDRESLVFINSGNSGSSEVINYGSGTEADPFIIRTANDLAAIGSGAYDGNGVELIYSNTSYYVLANDIDLTRNYGPGLQSWNPIMSFKGVLEGNNYEIKGLYIDHKGDTQAGLFANIDNGTVKNLKLSNVVILANETEKTDNKNAVGSLVGRMSNQSLIENIIVSNVNITAERERVGGVVGVVSNTSIVKQVYVEGNVTGTGRVGGLVGVIDGMADKNAELLDSVFIGNVVSKDQNRTGGAVGYMAAGNVKNLYIEANITSETNIQYVGGVIGYINGTPANSNVTNVLANVKITTLEASNVGIIVGAKQSTAVPVYSSVYHTLGSEIVSGKTSASNSYAGEKLEGTEDKVWFETNMSSFFTDNLWEFKEGAHRPSLIGTPDDGMIKEI